MSHKKNCLLPVCLLTHGEPVLGGVPLTAHINIDVPMLPPVMNEMKPFMAFTAVFILIGPWVTHYTHSRYGWLPLGTNISQSKQQWPEVDSVRAHGLCEGGVSEGCDHAMSALRVTAAL